MLDELSIIIPTLNEVNYLPKLLNSLIEQEFAGKLQVIIVDGKSEDRTVEVAKSFKKTFKDLLIVETHSGIAHQRNLGVKKAKYEYLLFIDADIILTKNFLKRLSKKIPTGTDFISPFFLWCSEVDLRDYLSFLLLYSFILPTVIIEKATPGGLLLTTKTVHNHVGGFNEKIRNGEDLEYGSRIKVNDTKYHFLFSPFALHSPRRLRKMGRLQFALLYLKGFYYVKRYGLNSINTKIHYPFGHYDK